MSHQPRYAIPAGPAPDWQIQREARRVENLAVRRASERFGRESFQYHAAAARRALCSRFTDLVSHVRAS
jgi:hypothetical protein